MMKAHSRKIILKFSIVFIMIFLKGVTMIEIWFHKPNPNLPVYAGRTADEWFNDAVKHSLQDPINQKKTDIAFKEMGSQSIPYLISRLKLEETHLDRRYANFYESLPSLLRKPLPTPFKKNHKRMLAIRLLNQMPASNLNPFSGELFRIFPNSISTHHLLKYQGRKEYMFTKINAFTNYLAGLDAPDLSTRLNAAINLAQLDPSSTNGIPTLLNYFTNSFTRIGSIEAKNIQEESRNDLRQTEVLNALLKVAPELVQKYSR